MRTLRTSEVRFGPLVLCMVALLLSAVALSETTTSAELKVERTLGAVKLRMQDKWQSPTAGMTVSLPAVVSTGDDGSLKMRQGDTTISVAANTALEFFADAAAGSVLQRVVQDKGSAFYDVAPRESNRLRVETPYLVAVIKGTEFDVTIADETTSISLFEGRLQIEAEDIGEVVQLLAGQIARRHAGDAQITILNMSDGEPIAQNKPRAEAGAGSGQSSGSNGVTAIAGTGTAIDAGVGLGAELGAGSLEFEGAVSAELLGAPLELGLGVDADLGAGGLDLGLGAGEAALDLGLDAGGVDVELDLGIDPIPVVDAGTVIDDVVDLIPDPADLLGL